MADTLPSDTEINKMNKDTLKTTLLKIVSQLKDKPHAEAGVIIPQNISDMLKEILDAVQSRNREVDTLKNEVEDLKTSNAKLATTLEEQQRFLESIDYEKRACNVVVMGVPEDEPLSTGDGESATDDHQKINYILQAIGFPNTEMANLHRLGKKSAENNSKDL